MIPVEPDAGPQGAGPGRQRPAVFKRCSLALCQLQRAKIECGAVHRVTAGIRQHFHNARAVARRRRGHRRHGVCTRIRHPQRLQRNGLPCEAGAFPVDTEVLRGERIIDVGHLQRVIPLCQHLHGSRFRRALLPVPHQHLTAADL